MFPLTVIRHVVVRLPALLVHTLGMLQFAGPKMSFFPNSPPVENVGFSNIMIKLVPPYELLTALSWRQIESVIWE